MTTLCLVFCDTDKEIAQKICLEGGYENPFPAALFEDYAGRLERPNPANRWDQPLFHLRVDEETPLEDIAKAVVDGKKPRDPVSTKPVTHLLFIVFRSTCLMRISSMNQTNPVKK